MEKEYTEDSIRFVLNGAEKAAIKEEAADNIIKITLSGELNSEVANTLLDEMTALVVAGQGIVIDLDQTSYVSASMMEVFLRTEKLLEKNNKFMRIAGMSQKIYDEFKARGLHELLDIEVKKA
ncbi:MAG: STAS domain-containing protein [Clostridia bacterium]|nr:STAS domain-containing protein [Clostridia bacterium]